MALPSFVSLYHSSWGDWRMIDSAFFPQNADVVTHIIHFKVDPIRSAPYMNFDGGVENHAKNRAQIIADAHAHGLKVLLCIGGVANGSTEWKFITQNQALTQTVVDTMSAYAVEHGYDGLDLDWEGDVSQSGFILLSQILRTKLNTWTHAQTPDGKGILAAAVGREWWAAQDVPTLNALYDQVNIMAYDGNAYWSCWDGQGGKSGFHEPLYDPSPNWPGYCYDGALVNIDRCVKTWSDHGLNKAKSSILIALYGWAWKIVTAPAQQQSGCASNCAGYALYMDVMSMIVAGGVRHYDNLAQQPWISLPGGESSYCNYQDAQSIQAKLEYLMAEGWGGLGLFSNEHAADVNKPVAERWPLLNAVRDSIGGDMRIIQHPVAATVLVGGTATFTIVAAGQDSVRWQSGSSSSGPWADVPGANLTMLTLANVQLEDDGLWCRCVITKAGLPDIASNAARLSVTSGVAPSITSQPQSLVRSIGESATFSVSATGIPTPTYRWQISTDGGVQFDDIDGAVSSSYVIGSPALIDNGSRYRCVVTNSVGSVTSSVATLTIVVGAPSITVHPISISVLTGSAATFMVSAQGGSGILKYSWERSNDGATYLPVGASTATYSFVATANDSGARFRCVVSNDTYDVSSNSALLTVTEPAVEGDPTDGFVGPFNTPIIEVTGLYVRGAPLVGQINGSNVDFQTPNPYVAGTLEFFHNGVSQERDVHYIESSDISVHLNGAPILGDSLTCSFQIKW